MQKSFTVWQNYFSIKSYSTFSAKMFQVPSFGNTNNMVYILYTNYMVETERKKKKTTKHGEMRWTPTKTVKIATSEIHFSILKRNSTIL